MHLEVKPLRCSPQSRLGASPDERASALWHHAVPSACDRSSALYATEPARDEERTTHFNPPRFYQAAQDWTNSIPLR